MFGLIALTLTLAADASPRRMEWTVDGLKREALVISPVKALPKAPLIFVFHGHGGTMRNALNTMPVHKYWPEAVVVYMQGIPTPGKLTDPEGKRTGWQHGPGAEKDRDLKFFDTVLASMKKDFVIDEKRIYATGHSNGGGFTYTLWAARGEVFAAVAPSASAASYYAQLKPKPVMHVAGKNDELVKFAVQERMMKRLRQLNECEPSGKPAGKNATEYPSKLGMPVVEYIHAGTHKYPSEAPERIVEFFKRHPVQ